MTRELDADRGACLVVQMSYERLKALCPARGSVLLGIRDPDNGPVPVQPGWGEVAWFGFLDSGYDEETLEVLGPGCREALQGYLTPAQAHAMRALIDRAGRREVPVLVVSCRLAGRRSTTVARFAAQRLGAHLVASGDRVNPFVQAMLEHPDRYELALRRALRQPPGRVRVGADAVRVPSQASIVRWLRGRGPLSGPEGSS